jgi:hypothetical protein
LLSDVGDVDFTQFTPTSASVSVGGRVMTADGLGIRRAQITLTEADGTIRTILTGGFGYYRFDGIEAGQTIVISVSSKRFVFQQPTQIINVAENISAANFTAEP